jgi:hypothetical protein
MTKLEKLLAAAKATEAASKSAYYVAHDAATKDAALVAWATYYDVDYARIVAFDAYKAELKKVQEENPMTKLEELKAVSAAWVAVDATYAAYDADAWDAYCAELKKTQEENSDDDES